MHVYTVTMFALRRDSRGQTFESVVGLRVFATKALANEFLMRMSDTDSRYGYWRLVDEHEVLTEIPSE